MKQTRLELLLHAVHTQCPNRSKVPTPMTFILIRECEIHNFGALNGERCQEKSGGRVKRGASGFAILT